MNNFAISSKGVGDALLNSASALSAANNTLDESIGLIVAANATIQNPNVVGNALKTISMRLRNTAGELETLGEDATGAAESVTKLQTQLLNLTSGKVDIMLNADTFKSTYQILTELSGVWDTLTDKAQADITRLVAGVRQGNVVESLMANMKSGIDATAMSMDSLGSATAENEVYLQSIQGKADQLTASFQKMANQLVDNSFVKWGLDAGNTIINLLTLFDSAGGKVVAFVAGLASVNAVMKTASVKQFTDGFLGFFKDIGKPNIQGFIFRFLGMLPQTHPCVCTHVSLNIKPVFVHKHK